MGILWTIVIGFVIGDIAKFLHPARDGMGFIMTTLVGIGGSLLATWIGQALGWYAPGQATGFIGATIGAIVLLAVYGKVKGRA